MRFLKRLLGILPLRIAYAHCDVPCGIYDPKPAQIAAFTVLKMVQKIKEIEASSETQGELQERNSFVRMVLTKEEHARKCKEEILVLWTDYFKPEHFEKFPDLHDIIWRTSKLCSQNKQNIDEKLAQELVEAVNKIVQIFEQSKVA